MITPFNPSVIARAVEVVDRSGVDAELLARLSPAGRGRRPSYNTRAFLVGALLAVQWKGSLVIRDVHRVLTQRLPIDVQRQLGVRVAGPEGDRLITEKHLFDIIEAVGRYLEFGSGSRSDLSKSERERRREVMLGMVHRLLDVTLPPPTSTSRAIDGTGIWSFGRMPRAAPKELLARDELGESLEDITEAVRSAEAEAAAEGHGAEVGGDPGEDGGAGARRRASDPDAGYGVKTRKDGKREVYWGYQLHALVRTPDRPGGENIPLFESFELTPAHLDIVGPSLRLLDRSASRGYEITDLLADRHYSYKAEERWYFELLARDIRQHVDLHPNDQGFRDYNGIKVAAAWAHCPSTPDRLGRIDPPGPTADKKAVEEFDAAIEERNAFAMRRVARPTADKGARWECPALANKVGCPLRPGTMEVAHLNGLPVVAAPPDIATAPACCTQRTVSTGLDFQPKVEQEFYWGSRSWRLRYNQRTFVEGAFGNMKNPTTENVERGFFRVMGLGKVTFLVGIALVAHNLRMLRGNTDLEDPGAGDLLLQADAPCHGFMFLTPEEEELVAAHRSLPAA